MLGVAHMSPDRTLTITPAAIRMPSLDAAPASNISGQTATGRNVDCQFGSAPGRTAARPIWR